LANTAKLLDIFHRARDLVARPENDFDWSSWRDSEDALTEIDGIISRLQANELPSEMSIIFAPTGPMQELALSSGWGNRFLGLATEFDAAISEPG